MWSSLNSADSGAGEEEGHGGRQPAAAHRAGDVGAPGAAPGAGEIYEAVARTGVAGFDPRAKRDRNLVNRELSDLAGMSPESHSKPAPRLLARVGRLLLCTIRGLLLRFTAT